MLLNKINHHLKKHANIAYQKFKKIRKKRSNLNILITTAAVVMIRR